MVWLVRLCGFGGQRGTRVNTSRDRVLLFPIRKHALLLCGSEKKDDCHKVGLLGSWLTHQLCYEFSHEFFEK